MELRELNKIVDLFLDFIGPVRAAVSDPNAAKSLLLELGYVPPPQFQFLEPLASSIQGIDNVAVRVRELDTGTEPDQAVIGEILADLAVHVPPFIAALDGITDDMQSEFGGEAFLTQTDILAKLPERLLNLLLVRLLNERCPTVFSVLHLFGVIAIEEVEVAGNEFEFPCVKYSIDWGKFGELFSDPKAMLLSMLRDGNGYFFKDILEKFQELGLSIGLFSNFRYPNVDVLQFINEDPAIIEWDGFPELEILRVPFAPAVNPDVAVDIYPLVDTATDRYTGLMLVLALAAELGFDISDAFRLTFTISANLTNGLGINIDENDEFTFIADPFTSPSSIADDLVVGAKAEFSSIAGAGQEPVFRIGSADGSRFELGDFAIALGVEKADEIELYAELDLEDGHLVIDLGESDSFVSNVAPSLIEADFNLGVGFSNQRGLYFKGGSGLEISLPTHIELGPIEIQGLGIGLIVQNGALPLIVDGTISANLGALKAVVENIGVKAVFRFVDDRSGNLGPLDLDVGFKPPNGVGLSIDAGVVKGGGYLFFDFDREEYAGALELVFSEWIALKAVGLITTKMPDGSDGFSLLVIVTAEFGTGIQLGFGFTLDGVGGILGLNRIVKVDPLKEGIRTGAVESVMFPDDVVANAPRIISDLRRFFPPQARVFLVGPMAKLGWGTPTLVSADIGVILEFPNVDITILGVIKVVLPDENADVLRLQVNFIGRVEPSNKLLWLYAELFDSRVLFITLEGGFGLLVNWGDQPNFVVSVGGFHPKYNPPPLPFPEPPRIAVSILNESYAKVRIEGYFAVTSNSVQFGARAELYFGVSEFRIEGHLMFDALFQFDPFYFSFGLSVSLSVKVFGIGLFSVGFSGLLEGPTPWYIEGKGKISLFLFSIKVPFKHRWGEDRDTKLEPIQVFPLLETEFAALSNWEAKLPASSHLSVSLRRLTEADTDKLVLHPVGRLRISQRKVPLNFTLDKIGNQRPADVQEVEVQAALPGAGSLTVTRVEEPFAIGQFQDLDASSQLSSPGFEPLESGIEITVAGEQHKTSRAVRRVIRHETIVIDNNFKRHVKRSFGFFVAGFAALNDLLFTHFLTGNSATQSVLSQHYKRRLQPFDEVVEVKPTLYSVASTVDNKPLDGASVSFTSHAKAEQHMQQQIRTGHAAKADVHVLPNTELNLAA